MSVNDVRNADPISEREFIIKKTLRAPARFLFEAYSKPEHVLRWFGPKFCPLVLCEMDFRVGGKYRFAMNDPQGNMMTPFGGEYLVIEKDRKISFTNTFEMPGAETMIMTSTFEEKEGTTTLTHHTLFGSIAMKAEHMKRGYEHGLGSSLDLYVELVEQLAQ